MPDSYDILSPGFVTRIMQQTQDVLTLAMPPRWTTRAAKPNVSDNEMTLKERQFIYMAPIISKDAVAPVIDSGDFIFQQHQSVKLKYGIGFNEEMLKLLLRLQQGTAYEADYFAFENYLTRQAKNLSIGAVQRQEAMISGMLADGYNYNRWGIQVGGTWGMPSDIKFNPSANWRNADGSVNTSATPVTDLVTALAYCRRHYNEAYDMISLTYSALQALVGTTEFQNIYASRGFDYQQNTASAITAAGASPEYYTPYLASFLAAAAGAQANPLDQGRPIIRKIMIEVVEDGAREYNADGTVGRVEPLHPGQGVVLFTDSRDFGNSNGWDLGNGQLVESMGGALGQTGMIGGFDAPMWGPIGYMTLANPTLNPPGYTMWFAQWCSPRKHRQTSSAKLTAFPG